MCCGSGPCENRMLYPYGLICQRNVLQKNRSTIRGKHGLELSTLSRVLINILKDLFSCKSVFNEKISPTPVYVHSATAVESFTVL